jgi:hypothetical protein
MDVPLLKTIVIDAGHSTPASMDLFSVTRGASVQGISLKSPSFNPTLFPLSQIRHLSLLGAMSVFLLIDGLEMLRQTPGLETCAMKTHYSSIPSTLQPISLNHLHQLCIIDGTWSGNAHIFNHIDVPNLRTLEYSSENSIPILTRLAAPDKLTRLGLSAPMSRNSLTACLRTFPMLQTLVVHRARNSLAGAGPRNDAIVGSLFSTLMPMPQNLSATICPHLQDIVSLGVDAGSDAELFSLIRARSTSGPDIQPLSRVHVVFARAQQLNNVIQLAASGVHTTLCYPTEADHKFMSGEQPWIASMGSVRRSGAPQKEDDYAADDWDPMSGARAAEYAKWGVALTWPL